ncbi:LPS-assembly protein LptD [Nitratidesulfovibrio sp. SRB-5]|uniref:LPS-assembly protein LptD n=1 Tax=Nitratidesulfovibrio sp. SRB-5 TaxID=2872636 RepID=UPI001026CEFF|nr:LPS assembly protein LptD [Nitratidesulfovibrio sp. SRB-5]MBZ2172495.1 LPS assembly protein LptD [Nitratidesulfovibrio sp. SRB-5]RXF77793.1 LPS-assembly protein LptD [Desulfovibrio sp. DS-1]
MTDGRLRPLAGFAAYVFLLLSGLLFAGGAHAAQPPQPNVLQMRTEDDREVTWNLTADSVTSQNDSKIIEAEGRVALRRGQDYLKADYIRYYSATNWVYLKGNVEVHFGKDDIAAEEAEFDLRSHTGWMKNGRIFMGEPHAYFAGERIDKNWGDLYTFTNAKITVCDGDTPAWSLTAEEAVVEIDGYARLWRSNFQVKNNDVAYSPYFVMPAKRTRQSGFLMPQYGISSRDGFYYNQPYYWVLNETSDVTLNEYFMSERGFMHGVEYRSRPTTDQTAWLRLDWLYDNKVVDSDGDDPIDSGDGLIRTNQERYWLRGMFEQRLGDPRWRLKGDLDYVSDQNYLREFKRGLGGFNDSRDNLFTLFGRDINERDRYRTSQVMLTRDWDRVSVALGGRYDQDPELGNGNHSYSSDSLPQRLPEADVYLHRGALFEELPLEVQASAQSVYFHRRNGTQGARHDVHPQVVLPVNGKYGSVISSVGLRQTVYDTERRESLPGDGGDSSGDSRTLPDYNIAASTEVARVYRIESAPLTLTAENAGQSRWTGIRHAVQPRVEYNNLPLLDQDDNPRYDGDDRIGARNELVYSITNVFTRKREMVRMKTNDEGVAEPDLGTDYLEFLRFKLQSGYDIREATRDEDLDTYGRRPVLDYRAEVQYFPVAWLSWRSITAWSPYTGDVTQHDHGLTLIDANRGQLTLGYNWRSSLDEYNRKRDYDINALYLRGEASVWGPWSVGGEYRVDIEQGRDLERIFDIIYTHQCFKLIGRTTVDREEERYEVLVVLPGLSE